MDNQGVESAYSNQSEATIPGGGSGTESSLYSFAGGSDPKLPYAGLIFDKAGNLYGTTEFGGTNGQGTVFEITPTSSGSGPRPCSITSPAAPMEDSRMQV